MIQTSNGISEETLQLALQYGIVEMDKIAKRVEMKKETKYFLGIHIKYGKIIKEYG